MYARDRVLQYLRRRRADLLPFDLELTAGARARYDAEIPAGMTDRAYFGAPFEVVGLAMAQARLPGADFERYYAGRDVPAGSREDEWGIRRYTNAQGVHGAVAPLDDVEAVDLRGYPFPDYTQPECRRGVAEQVAALQAAGKVVIGRFAGMLLAKGRDLRGFENHLMDYVLDEGFAHALLDGVLESQLGLVRSLCESGVDILWMNSDIASQQNLLIAPGTFRTFVKPRMAALYAEARRVKPDVLCAYHCCGNVGPIVGDLVDIGVDILNPVQPESLDLAWLHREFGAHLVFWGGLSVQKVLPEGTPEAVGREVRRLVEVLGGDGGYVVSPANEIPQDTPPENVRAFVAAAKAVHGTRSGGLPPERNEGVWG